MKSIKDKIIKSDYVRWRDFEFLQPDGFKELTKEAYQKLRNSIIENQFVESFKVWENGSLFCLDGHHRCKVLNILESEGYDVPEKFRADFLDCKDRKEAKKLVVVYSSRYAKILEDGLHEFVQDLNWEEISRVSDLPDVDLKQITERLMRDEKEEETDVDKLIDKAEELQKKWQVKEGDLWQLGKHKLCCGDSKNEETLSILTNNHFVDLIFTDPPYEIQSYDIYNWISKATKNTHVLVFASDKQIPYLIKSEIGEFKRLYILDTNIASPTNNDVYVNHIALLRFKVGRPCKFNNIHNGGRSIVKTDYRKNLKEDKFSKYQKKLETIELFIKYWSNKGDTVLDMFGGSGSTLIAAESLKRVCYINELQPAMCAVILQRYEDFTGVKPERIV